MIPIEQLITPLSADDVFEKLLAGLETVGIPARSWRPGGVGRSILGVVAELGYQGSSMVTAAVRGTFLAYAEGPWLTAHASDVYGVERVAATFASGQVTLTNAGGAIHDIGADELVVRSSASGARFRVTQAFVLGASSSITVDVQAVDAGAASTVAPGDIDTLETPLERVTVSNGASIVGRDAESDDALRARASAARGTWSALGPRDAYYAAAFSARLGDESPTSISRVQVSNASSTGTVTVVCATPTGTPSTADLNAVRGEIEAKARPDSVTVNVLGAVAHPTAKTIRIWARGGTPSLIIANAQRALAEMIAAYPIGGIAKVDGGQGYLYDDAIAATVIRSSPEPFDVDFLVGGGDVPLAPHEVATNTTTFEVRLR